MYCHHHHNDNDNHNDNNNNEQQEEQQGVAVQETIVVVHNNNDDDDNSDNNNNDENHHDQVEVVTTTTLQPQELIISSSTPNSTTQQQSHSGTMKRQGRRRQQQPQGQGRRRRSNNRGLVTGTPSSLSSIASIQEGHNEEDDDDDNNDDNEQQPPSPNESASSPRTPRTPLSLSYHRRQDLTSSPASSFSANSILSKGGGGSGGVAVTPPHLSTKRQARQEDATEEAAAIAAATCDPLVQPALSWLGIHHDNNEEEEEEDDDNNNNDRDGTHNTTKDMATDMVVTSLNNDKQDNKDHQGDNHLQCCGAVCFVVPSSHSKNKKDFKDTTVTSTSLPQSLPTSPTNLNTTTRTTRTTTTFHTTPNRSKSLSPSLSRSLLSSSWSPTRPVQWSSSSSLPLQPQSPSSLLEAVRSSSSPVIQQRLRRTLSSASPKSSSSSPPSLSNSSRQTTSHRNGQLSAAAPPPPTTLFHGQESVPQEPLQELPRDGGHNNNNDPNHPCPSDEGSSDTNNDNDSNDHKTSSLLCPEMIRLPVSLLERASLHDQDFEQADLALKELARRLAKNNQQQQDQQKQLQHQQSRLENRRQEPQKQKQQQNNPIGQDLWIVTQSRSSSTITTTTATTRSTLGESMSKNNNTNNNRNNKNNNNNMSNDDSLSLWSSVSLVTPQPSDRATSPLSPRSSPGRLLSSPTTNKIFNHHKEDPNHPSGNNNKHNNNNIVIDNDDDKDGATVFSQDKLFLLALHGPSSSSSSSMPSSSSKIVSSPPTTPVLRAKQVLPQQLPPLVPLSMSFQDKNDNNDNIDDDDNNNNESWTFSTTALPRTPPRGSPTPMVTPASPHRVGSLGQGRRSAWSPYMESLWHVNDDDDNDYDDDDGDDSRPKDNNFPFPTENKLSRKRVVKAHRRRVVEHILQNPLPSRSSLSHLQQQQQEQQHQPILSTEELESRLTLLRDTHSSITTTHSISSSCSMVEEWDNDKNNNNHKDKCGAFTATDQLLDRMAQLPLALGHDDDRNNTCSDEEVILLDLGRGQASDDDDDNNKDDHHQEQTNYLLDKNVTEQEQHMGNDNNAGETSALPSLWEEDNGNDGDNDVDGKEMDSKLKYNRNMFRDFGDDDDDDDDDEADDFLLPPPPSTMSSTTFHGTFFTHVLGEDCDDDEDDDDDDNDIDTSSSSSFPTTNGSESEMQLLDVHDLEDEDGDDVDVYSASHTSSFYQHGDAYLVQGIAHAASSSFSVSLADKLQDEEWDDEHEDDCQSEEGTIEPWVIPQSPDSSDNSDDDDNGRNIKQYFLTERLHDSTLMVQFHAKTLTPMDDIITPPGAAEDADKEPLPTTVTPTEESASSAVVVAPGPDEDLFVERTRDFNDASVDSINQKTHVITVTPPRSSAEAVGDSDQDLRDEKKEDDQSHSSGAMGTSLGDKVHNADTGPHQDKIRDQQEPRQGAVQDYRMAERAKAGAEMEASSGSLLGGIVEHWQRVVAIGPDIEEQQQKDSKKTETEQQERPKSETKGFLQDTASEIGSNDDDVGGKSCENNTLDSLNAHLETKPPSQQPEVAVKLLDSCSVERKSIEPSRDEAPTPTLRLLSGIVDHWQHVVGAESPSAPPQKGEPKETPRGSNRDSDKKAEKTNSMEECEVDMAELDTPPRVVKSMDSGFFDELPTATFTTTTAPVMEVVETQVDCVLQDADSCASCTSSVVKSYGFMASEDRNMKIRSGDEEGELASNLGTSSGGRASGSLKEDSSSIYSNSLNNSGHTNSTVVPLNSQEQPYKPARVDDQSMDDVQMMVETTFVSSSPLLLPQEPPIVEPFENDDRSCSDDVCEGESPMSQEGTISSSGTISNPTSSTGLTINTTASAASMVVTNSWLSPMAEEDVEMISSAVKAPPSVLLLLQARARGFLVRCKNHHGSNSTRDSTGREGVESVADRTHGSVPDIPDATRSEAPSFMDRQHSHLQREEGSYGLAFQVVVMQALARGHLARSNLRQSDRRLHKVKSLKSIETNAGDLDHGSFLLSLSRQQGLCDKALQVVMIQATVRGFLVRNKQRSTQYSAQKQNRNSEVGRCVPKSMTNILHLHNSASSTAKNVSSPSSSRAKLPEQHDITAIRREEHAARVITQTLAIHRAKRVLGRRICDREKQHRNRSADIVLRAWTLYRGKCELENKTRERRNSATRIIARAFAQHRSICVLARKIKVRKEERPKRQREDQAARVITGWFTINRARRILTRRAEVRKLHQRTTAADVIGRAWCVYRCKCDLENKRRERASQIITRALARHYAQSVLDSRIALRKQEDNKRKQDHAARTISSSVAINHAQPNHARRPEGWTLQQRASAADVVIRAWAVYSSKCVLEMKREERRNEASRLIARSLVRHHTLCLLERKIAFRKDEAQRQQEINAARIIAGSLAVNQAKRILARKAQTRALVRRTCAADVVRRSWAVFRSKCVLEMKREERRNGAAVIIARAFGRHRSACVLERKIALRKVEAAKRHKEYHAARVIAGSLAVNQAKRILARKAQTRALVRRTCAADVVRRSWAVFRSKCVLEMKREERRNEAAVIIARAFGRHQSACVLERKIALRKVEAAKRHTEYHAARVIAGSLAVNHAKRILARKAQTRALVRRTCAADVVRRSWAVFRSKCVLEMKREARRNEASVIIARAFGRHRSACVLERKIALRKVEAAKRHTEYHAARVIAGSLAVNHAKRILARKAQTRALVRRTCAADVVRRSWAVFRSKRVLEMKREERRNEAAVIIARAFGRHRSACVLERKIALRKVEAAKRHTEYHAARVIAGSLAVNHAKRILARKAQTRALVRRTCAADVVRRSWAVFRSKRVLEMKREERRNEAAVIIARAFGRHQAACVLERKIALRKVEAAKRHTEYHAARVIAGSLAVNHAKRILARKAQTRALVRRTCAADVVRRSWAVFRSKCVLEMKREERRNEAAVIIARAFGRHQSACVLERKIALRKVEAATRHTEYHAARVIAGSLAVNHAKRILARKAQTRALVRRTCAADIVRRSWAVFRSKCVLEMKREERRNEAAVIIARAVGRHQSACVLERKIALRKGEAAKRHTEYHAARVIAGSLAVNQAKRILARKAQTRALVRRTCAADVVRRSWAVFRSKCVLEMKREERRNEAAVIIARAFGRHQSACVLERKIALRKVEAAKRHTEYHAARVIAGSLAVNHAKRILARKAQTRALVRRTCAADVVRRSWAVFRSKCVLEMKREERRNEAAVIIARAVGRHQSACVLERKIALRKVEAAKRHTEYHAARVIAGSLAVNHAKRILARKAQTRALVRRTCAADVVRRSWAVFRSKCVLEMKREERRNEAAVIIARAVGRHQSVCVLERKIALRKGEAAKRHTEYHAARVIAGSLAVNHAKRILARKAQTRALVRRTCAADVVRRSWAVFRSKCVLEMKREERRNGAAVIIARAFSRRQSSCALEGTIALRKKEKNPIERNAVSRYRDRMNGAARIVQLAWAGYRSKCRIGRRKSIFRTRGRRTSTGDAASNAGNSGAEEEVHEPNAFSRRRDRMLGAAKVIQRAWVRYRARCVFENNQKKQKAVARQRDRLTGAVEVVQRAWTIYRVKCLLDHMRQERNAVARQMHRITNAANAVQRAWVVHVARRLLEQKRRERENKATRIIVRTLACHRFMSVLRREFEVRKQDRIRLHEASKANLVEQARKSKVAAAAIIINRSLARYHGRCAVNQRITAPRESKAPSVVRQRAYELHELTFAAAAVTIYKAVVVNHFNIVLEKRIAVRKEEKGRLAAAIMIQRAHRRHKRTLAAIVIIYRALDRNRTRSALKKRIAARKREDEKHWAAVVVIQRAYREHLGPLVDSKQKDSGMSNRSWILLLFLIGGSLAAVKMHGEERPCTQESEHHATWAGVHHHSKPIYGHSKHRHDALRHLERRQIEDYKQVDQVPVMSSLLSVPQSPPRRRQEKDSSKTKDAGDVAGSTEPFIPYFDPWPYLSAMFRDDKRSRATWAGIFHHHKTVFGHKHRHAGLSYLERQDGHTDSIAPVEVPPQSTVTTREEKCKFEWSEVMEWEWLADRVTQKDNGKPSKTDTEK